MSKTIVKIELTPEEAGYYSKIPKGHFVPDSTVWPSIADAMQDLMESLEERGAIPEIRRTVFFRLAEKGSKSTFEIFKSNGTTGADLFRDGNFVKYLHYFINGPDLPPEVIDGFVKIVNDDRGTSGMLLTELQKYVRKSVRDYRLAPNDAATNFWRLCHELDYFSVDAIRKAAMTAN